MSKASEHDLREGSKPEVNELLELAKAAQEPKCDECGAGVGRPKCPLELPPNECPRHEPAIRWRKNRRKFTDAALAQLTAILEENQRLKDYIASLPANWDEDSSLETWFPLTAEELKRTKAENQRLAKENIELEEILEGERSKVADGVAAIHKVLRQHGWLQHGRGPYAFSDDQWYQEFAIVCDNIRNALNPLEKIAGNLTKCPIDWKIVVSARTDWKARAEAAEGRLEKMREVLRKIRDYDSLGADPLYCCAIRQFVEAALAE